MKPAFDPNKPFEVAGEAPIGAKPEFDPSKPFEAAPTTKQPQTEEKGTVEQLLTGAARGSRTALNSFGQTKEDYHADRGGLETVAELATNLATGGAVGAGIGAAYGALGGPLGSLGGAGVGALIYGIYAALGNEYSRAKAEGQDFSVPRAIVGVGLEANPFMKTASKVSKGLRVGAQVLGQAGSEYSYSKSPEAAGFAGLAALLTLPSIMHGGGATKAAMPSTVKSAAQVLAEDEGQALLYKTAQRVNALPEAQLKYNPTAEPDIGFMRSVVGDLDNSLKMPELVQQFKEVSSKVSPEVLNDRWYNHQWGRIMNEEAAAANERIASKLASGEIKEPISFLGRLFADAKFVGRAADKVSGQNLAGDFDTVSKITDDLNTIASGFYHTANKAYDASKALKLDNKAIGKALAGREDLLKPAERAALKSHEGQAALSEWRHTFDNVYQELRNRGHDVGYLEHYLPLKSLQGADLAFAVTNRIKDLEKRALAQGKHSFLEMVDDPEFKELKQVAGHYFGTETPTAKDIVGFRNAVLDKAKSSSGYKMSALFERRNELPDFGREWDAGKLLKQYINGNLKAAMLTPTLDKLATQAKALRKLGLDKTADWVDTYVAHQSGQPGTVPKFLSAAADRIRLRGLELEAGGNTKLGKAVARTPDFVAWLNSQVHPAFLGGNIRATLRNTTQPITTTAPELGGLYGYGLVLKGMAKTATDLKDFRGFKNAKAYLEAKGLGGSLAKSEFDRLDLGLPGKLRRHADAANAVLMDVYDRSETVNKLVVDNAARAWANDIKAGSRAGIKALERLDTGTKQRLRVGGIDRMSADELGDVLSDYLVGKTIFRYGKTQMSQLGREMGQAFTQFTKWPVMVGSDVAEMARARQWGRLVDKTAPYMALLGVQAAMRDKDSPLYQYFVGDISKLSPLDAASGFETVTGGPLLKAGLAAPASVFKLIKGTPDERKQEASGIVRGALKTYLPPVSSAINELDRWHQAHGEPSVSRGIANKLTGREP